MGIMERAGKEIWKLQKFGEMVDELFARGVKREEVLAAVEKANKTLAPLFETYDKELTEAKKRYDNLPLNEQLHEADPLATRRWITTMRQLLRRRSK